MNQASKKIEDTLNLRFPKRRFMLDTTNEISLTIWFDAFANESDENKLTKFIDKLLQERYPNIQYKIQRTPF